MEIEIVDPDGHHPNHYTVVAVFDSGERLEVIGFKVRRDAVIIRDKLRTVIGKCTRNPRKKKEKSWTTPTQ